MSQRLKWPPQPPKLNPVVDPHDLVERKLHIMDVHLQQLNDAVVSIGTKIFQHLDEASAQKAVLKAKKSASKVQLINGIQARAGGQ